MSDIPYSTDNISLMFVLKCTIKYKRRIILNVIYVSLLTGLLSLIIPKTFTAISVLMPPGTQPNISLINAFSESMMPFAGLTTQLSEESMRLIAILKSRRLLDIIIIKYDLIDLFQSDNIEEAEESLMNIIEFEIEEEGTLSITVHISTGMFHYEKDENQARSLCADIANEFVIQLDIINKELQKEEALTQRIFIEERYMANINDLQNAEEKLKQFQKKHNTISIEEQASASIESATELTSRISIAEVKLNLLKETLPKNHPEVKLMILEIEGLNVQLDEIYFGNTEISMIPAFSEIPDIGIELGRLTREVEIQNLLHTFFTQKYEEAKIQEARNTPTIQQLDRAVSPIKKTSPKRILMTIVMAVITMISTSIYAVAIENHNRFYNIS